jgi:hypothetical protein
MQQKTIWTLFLIIGISVLANSCGKRIHPMYTVTYVYKNGTAFDLVIKVYDKDSVNFKNFSIAPNQSVEIGTISSETPLPFLFFESTMKSGQIVVVRFNNNRCLSYSRQSSVGPYGDKIFDYREYDNYTPDLVEKSKFTLYYTITVDDYNESVDCE